MGYTQNGAIFGAIFQLDTFPEMTILLGVFFILLVIMSYWLDEDIVHIPHYRGDYAYGCSREILCLCSHMPLDVSPHSRRGSEGIFLGEGGG